MKILAVDPGTKNIGLAVSDPTGTIARPLVVLPHISRVIDAAAVAEQAAAQGVELIIVGQSMDEDGEPSLAGRQAAHFAETLKVQTSVPVFLWDEAFTTSEARKTRIDMGVNRKKRAGHLDDLAAALLLQSYLESLHSRGNKKK